MNQMPVQNVICRIKSREIFTDRIFALRVKAKDGCIFDHAPGQYAIISLPSDDSHDPRPYSIASMPDTNELVFHIKDVGRGLSHALMNAPEGTEVALEYPLGSAVYRPKKSPIIAIGGGLGLAPILPIIRTALKDDPSHDVFLYHGAAKESDLYLDEKLKSMCKTYPHLEYKGVIEDIDGTVGAIAAAAHDDLSNFNAYLSGAPAMVIACFKALEEKGLDIKNTISDALSGEIKDFV